MFQAQIECSMWFLGRSGSWVVEFQNCILRNVRLACTIKGNKKFSEIEGDLNQLQAYVLTQKRNCDTF